ncbi:serine--tRNA synthetase-like protein Slimp [Drosophila grimshawi]|uniref:GH19093 n=1 Tax=Drosophila grimshawi TaxID=7222 RepID=B4JIG0_DROGR|nr:serine--tRNA synthetase-like protein Slimp [Drosophila grimshawi]EDV93041.1 GH19093 [Drosophila grimshawi]
MLKLGGVLRKSFFLKRYISALYITGDKANEHYVTIQPFLDFAGTFRDRAALDHSISSRGLNINLETVLSKYKNYQTHHEQLLRLEKERDSITKQLKLLTKSGGSSEQLNALRENGKVLRNDAKELKQKLYPIEDDFIHEFLHLPNSLHSQCPASDVEKLIYMHKPTASRSSTSHLERKDLVHFVNNNCYYLMEQAAHFDVRVMQSLANYFVTRGDFVQTSNPDFVRCVLLEANATPLTHYYLVQEEHLQNKLNTAYLTGCGSFESFLGAMTKLSVYPSVLPMRFVACGRSYNREEALLYGPTPSLYTATQTNAVQSFVATQTADEADTELERVLNLAVDFYKSLDVPFRIVYTPAVSLTASESLRASIEVYAPSLKRYVCLGRISNFGDYVSKRILFSARREKHFDFLHLVGGPVLYTTRLIAALIELGVELPLGTLPGAQAAEPSVEAMTQHQRDLQEFKDLFK